MLIQACCTLFQSLPIYYSKSKAGTRIPVPWLLKFMGRATAPVTLLRESCNLTSRGSRLQLALLGFLGRLWALENAQNVLAVCEVVKLLRCEVALRDEICEASGFLLNVVLVC